MSNIVDYPIHHPIDTAYTTTESLIAPLCVNHVNDERDGSKCPYSMEGGVVPCLVKYPYIECTYVATGSTDESGGTVVSPVKLYHRFFLSNVIGMTIDGELSEDVVSSYTFSSIGEHVVRFYSKASKITSFSTDSAFTNCVQLTKVSGLGNVTSVRYVTFRGCSQLVSTDYTEKLVNIEIGAFKGCSSLVTPGDVSGVVSIKQSASDGAFEGCSSLRKLNFSSKFTTLVNATTNYGRTFLNCRNLVSVGDFSHVGPSVGEDGFGSCTSIKSINLAGVNGYIGQRCFRGCTSLKEVKDTEGIKRYEQHCFSGCTALTGEFIVGEGCTLFNSYAFSGCRSLTSMKILAVTPPQLVNSDMFDGSTYKIYVPAESLEAYKTASQWRNVSDRIFPIE